MSVENTSQQTRGCKYTEPKFYEIETIGKTIRARECKGREPPEYTYKGTWKYVGSQPVILREFNKGSNNVKYAIARLPILLVALLATLSVAAAAPSGQTYAHNSGDVSVPLTKISTGQVKLVATTNASNAINGMTSNAIANISNVEEVTEFRDLFEFYDELTETGTLLNTTHVRRKVTAPNGSVEYVSWYYNRRGRLCISFVQVLGTGGGFSDAWTSTIEVARAAANGVWQWLYNTGRGYGQAAYGYYATQRLIENVGVTVVVKWVAPSNANEANVRANARALAAHYGVGFYGQFEPNNSRRNLQERRDSGEVWANGLGIHDSAAELWADYVKIMDSTHGTTSYANAYNISGSSELTKRDVCGSGYDWGRRTYEKTQGTKEDVGCVGAYCTVEGTC